MRPNSDFFMKRIFWLFLFLYCLSAKAEKWEYYPTYSTFVTYMQQTAKDHSDICRLDTIGTSINNRLILCLKISSEPNSNLNKPKFFYSAAIHGNELTGSVMLLRLIDSLINNPELIITSNLPDIYICPFANPDGTWHGGNDNVKNAIRYNANYVDLNRNFPDIRSNTNSDGELQQKETTAFIEYQNKERFNMSCNIHTGSEVFNYPWDTYRSNQKTHADKIWFDSLGENFVKHLQNDYSNYFTDVNNNGVVNGGDWYVIYGSRQDWSTYFAHCREITLEISMDYMPKESLLNDYWYRLKNSLFTFFDYCNIGFQGIVTDSITNQPINDVIVSIDNHDKDSSQVYTNDNGYYFRPILNGTYSVTFSKDGYHSKTMEISIGDVLTENNVELSPINTSLTETLSPQIQIYPLPARNIINVQSNQNLRYEIFDLNARITDKGVINTPLTTIDIQNLQSGSYIIKMYNNKQEIITRKIIKQ